MKPSTDTVYERVEVKMSTVMEALSALLDHCDEHGKDFESMVRDGRDRYLKSKLTKE